MTQPLSSLYPDAKVDSLLALENPSDCENATFLRFIQDCDTDDSIICIMEVACYQHSQSIWCYERPKADFPASPEGRVVLSGLHLLPDELDKAFAPLVEFLSELLQYEWDGRGENGVIVTALECNLLKGKAWHREEAWNQEEERRSLMVALWDAIGWIAQHFGLGA
ncbi:hypothetical protein GGI42DRAFT_310134 [Trichoderma sp. SZMC 28013]